MFSPAALAIGSEGPACDGRAYTRRSRRPPFGGEGARFGRSSCCLSPSGAKAGRTGARSILVAPPHHVERSKARGGCLRATSPRLGPSGSLLVSGRKARVGRPTLGVSNTRCGLEGESRLSGLATSRRDCEAPARSAHTVSWRPPRIRTRGGRVYPPAVSPCTRGALASAFLSVIGGRTVCMHARHVPV